MYHGLSNQFLYSALKIVATFVDYSDKQKSFVGTAFYIKYKQEFHLITNRHNVDIIYANPDFRDYRLSKLAVSGRLSGENYVEFLLPIKQNTIYYSNIYSNDIAIISNPQMLPLSGNPFVLNNYINESMIAKDADFQSGISVCDFVAFPGYPEWHDASANRPIFRSGTIASDPRFNYSFEKIAGDCVAYEAFSYGGSSGSPIFALQKGLQPGAGMTFAGYREAMFIGINAGHLFEASDNSDKTARKHSGISYFYKSSAILQAIDDARARAVPASGGLT